MKYNNLRIALQDNIGYNGMMISGSKSGYRDRNPDNLVIFNANICIYDGGAGIKLWYGDIDITLSYDKLMDIAITHDIDIYVLYEMDARFENEDDPLMDRYAFKAGKNGISVIGNSLSHYYERKNNTILKKQIIEK